MAEQTNRTLRVGALMLAGIAILSIAIFSMGGELRMLSGSDSFSFTVSDGTLTGTASATIYNKLVPITLPQWPPIGVMPHS